MRLIIFKKQKIQKLFLFTSPLAASRVCSWSRAITGDVHKEYGLGVVGKTQQGLEIRVHSVPHGFCMVSKHFFSKHLLFISMLVAFLPFEIPNATLNIFFYFDQRQHLK